MSRRARWSMWVAIAIVWAGAMWVVVFPWLDNAFISRPEV